MRPIVRAVFNNNTEEVQIYYNNVAGDLRCNNQDAKVVTSGNFVRGRDTCRLR